MTAAPVPVLAGKAAETSMVIYPHHEALALGAAALFVVEARRAVKRSGRFTVALAGGSTPKRTYELLATPPLAGMVPWELTHVFWGDERCVNPADSRSNERMARETLLDHVAIPPDQVHPMRCDGLDSLPLGSGFDAGRLAARRAAERAADDYQALLRGLFPSRDVQRREELSPTGGNVVMQGIKAAGVDEAEAALDLVLLGLGENGHTASLFPGSPVMQEKERWVAAAFVDTAAGAGTTASGEDMWRITLTAPFINRTGLVAFLVSGPAKAKAVRDVLQGTSTGPADPTSLPASLIDPTGGRLCWLLDEESAALIAKESTK